MQLEAHQNLGRWACQARCSNVCFALGPAVATPTVYCPSTSALAGLDGALDPVNASGTLDLLLVLESVRTHAHAQASRLQGETPKPGQQTNLMRFYLARSSDVHAGGRSTSGAFPLYGACPQWLRDDSVTCRGEMLYMQVACHADQMDAGREQPVHHTSTSKAKLETRNLF